MNQFNRNTIYALKRTYGVKAVLYRIISKTLNLTTGQQVITTSTTTIRRVIFLPTNIERITLSRGNFYFDPNKRLVVIDHRDVDFIIKVGDYIIHNTSKYNIIEVNDYELDAAFSLIVQSDDRAKWLLASNNLVIAGEASHE